MCSRYILQVVNLVYPGIHLVLEDKVKQLISIAFELLSGVDIVEKRRSRDLEVLLPQTSARSSA